MTDSEKTYAEVDASALPLVTVTVVGPISEESFIPYLEELLEAIQLRERVVLRMHSGPLTAFPPRFVRMSVAWMNKHEAILKRHVVAVSIVMKSSLLRMATQAMVWASKPSFPVGAMRNKADADAWLFALLKEDAVER